MKINVLLLSVVFSIFSLTAMERNTAYTALAKCCAMGNKLQRGVIFHEARNIPNAEALIVLQKTQEEKILHALLTNPQVALQYAYKVYHQCCNELHTSDAKNNNVSELMQKIITQFEKECPIFFLGECDQEDSSRGCILSRSHEPKNRAAYEKHVVGALLKILSANKLTQYASCASGGLFQDLVVLSKALHEKPDAQIDIHLIDAKFMPYMSMRDVLDNTREVKLDYSIDPNNFMRVLKEVNPEFQETSRARKIIAADIVRIEPFIKQFVRQLKTTFPRARLAVNVHGTVATYCDYVSRKRLDSPDVIVGADIQDESNPDQNSIGDYYQLCREGLIAKPNLYNKILVRSNNKAMLNTLRIHNNTLEISSEEIK
ncbi:MAG: hypothetical protein WC707_02540 [Candidatus Babeliaceae bacterium]|jgi:hypothetical protein